MEVFEKLINLAGDMGVSVVFMPMKSKSKGLLSSVSVGYTQEEMEKLIHLAKENKISVKFVPFMDNNSRLKYAETEVRIGIRMGMSFNEYVYTLAHELAHYFLHFDKGDKKGSYTHCPQCRRRRNPTHSFLSYIKIKRFFHRKRAPTFLSRLW